MFKCELDAQRKLFFKQGKHFFLSLLSLGHKLETEQVAQWLCGNKV